MAAVASWEVFWVQKGLLLFGFADAVLVEDEFGYGVAGGVADELDLGVDDFEKEFCVGLSE